MASKTRERLVAILAWVVVWQIAAMTLGHGGLFLATPLQTLTALGQLLPTAAFWHRIAFSALRIVAGFLLAVAGGGLWLRRRIGRAHREHFVCGILFVECS